MLKGKNVAVTLLHNVIVLATGKITNTLLSGERMRVLGIQRQKLVEVIRNSTSTHEGGAR